MSPVLVHAVPWWDPTECSPGPAYTLRTGFDAAPRRRPSPLCAAAQRGFGSSQRLPDSLTVRARKATPGPGAYEGRPAATSHVRKGPSIVIGTSVRPGFARVRLPPPASPARRERLMRSR